MQKKMGRKKINNAYRYFKLNSNETSNCLVEGCGKVLMTTHSGNLTKHLRHQHEAIYKEVTELNSQRKELDDDTILLHVNVSSPNSENNEDDIEYETISLEEEQTTASVNLKPNISELNITQSEFVDTNTNTNTHDVLNNVIEHKLVTNSQSNDIFDTYSILLAHKLRQMPKEDSDDMMYEIDELFLKYRRTKRLCDKSIKRKRVSEQ